MDFDEWWGTQNPDHLDEITAREVWYYQQKRIAELESQLDGAHTCNQTCQRPLCVARRRIEELEEIAAEYDSYRKETTQRIAELEAENQRLREALREISTMQMHDIRAVSVARAALLREVE